VNIISATWSAVVGSWTLTALYVVVVNWLGVVNMFKSHNEVGLETFEVKVVSCIPEILSSYLDK
jgi:hypothetical protein